MGKESACNTGDTGDAGSILGLRRSPGGGRGNPLQYFCPENQSRGLRSLVVYSSKGCKELDMTVQLHTHILLDTSQIHLLSISIASQFPSIVTLHIILYFHSFIHQHLVSKWPDISV